MKKRVELPLVEPLYKTYHHYALTTSIISRNTSIRNWFLSNAVNLECNRKFLSGYTSPEITITCAGDMRNDLFEKLIYPMRFLGGHINSLIKNLLEEGYYIHFFGIDDYYIEGKSFYKERHFSHNGMICGYDQNEKMYCIYAYDKNWIYRKFWTPQKCFDSGRNAMFRKGKYGMIEAYKPKSDNIEFSLETALQKIKVYLDSNVEKYPFNGEGKVYGIVVHKYIVEYISKLHKGDIPYERMDRRVFRMLWEHKKVMLERIEKIEEILRLDNEISEEYRVLVSEADMMRMLYASHHMKRRDSVLPIIKKKVLSLMKNERELLSSLVEKAERKFDYEIMELS